MTAAEFALAALVTTVAVVVARFMWVFPSLYLPRLLIPSVRRADPYPIWQRPFLVSFFGVRGIVSLAAALALPLTTATGMPFPHRDLILLLTFWVILITLVGQGLLLPPVLRWLGLGKVAETEQKEERKRRTRRPARRDRRGAAAARPARKRAQPAGTAGRRAPRAPSGAAQPRRMRRFRGRGRRARSRSMTRSKGCSSIPNASTFSASSNAAS